MNFMLLEVTAPYTWMTLVYPWNWSAGQ